MTHCKTDHDRMAFWRFMFLAQCALNIAVLGFFVAGSAPSDARTPSSAPSDSKAGDATFDTVRARRFLVMGPDGQPLAKFIGTDDGGCLLGMTAGPKRRSVFVVAITPAGVVQLGAWHPSQPEALVWTLNDRGQTVSAKGPGGQSAVGVQLTDKLASVWTRSGKTTTHWRWGPDGHKTWSATTGTDEKTDLLEEAVLRFMKLLLEAIRSELD